MASFSFAPDPASRRRIPIAEIDAVVCARLGPTRGLGNSQPACFNRQVAMYLAKHVGGWTTTIIGRFYHGRDHSTVCYGIQRIEAMRDNDADVDTLVGELRRHLLHEQGGHHDDKDSGGGRCKPELPALGLEELADLIAERVYARLEERIHLPEKKEEQNHAV
jgi:hypothetical protein